MSLPAGGQLEGEGRQGVKGAWRWNCPEQRHIEACVGFDTSINLPKRDFNDRRNRCALWGFVWALWACLLSPTAAGY